MESLSEYYAIEAVKEISKGYVKGGLSKLKETYPEAYEAMESKLMKNFNRDGVDKYVKDLIFGLNKIGYWN